MTRRKQMRLAAAVLAAMLAASGTAAYADSIEIAAYPGAQTTTASGSTSAQSSTQTTVTAPAGQTADTQSGPGTSTSTTISASGPAQGSDVIEIPDSGTSGTSGQSQTPSGNTQTSGAQTAQTPGSSTSAQTPSGTGSAQTVQTPDSESGPGSTQTGSTSAQSPAGSASTGQNITISASVTKPTVESEAAVLMDAATGQLLYTKNSDERLYPASITKLMTALLVAENGSLDDTVTYQASAVENLESGAANVNLTAGDTLSVRDSLYALLLKSACEVANGLAEHVSGTQSAFADKMNARAKELGASNTHFVNASGLNDAEHVTTAHDMALIARAAFQNDTVRKIAGTLSYELPASKKRGVLAIKNGNKMLNPQNAQYYAGIVAGKTGYTSKAGNTLVTEVTKNGHTLIAVVMKSKSKQYSDTKALLDYGFKLYDAAGSSSSGTSSNTGAGTTGTTPGSGTTGTTTGTTPGTTKPGSSQTSSNQAGPSGSSTGTSSSTASGKGHWQQNGSAWNYVKADGTLAKSEWIDVNGKSYYIGSDNKMITGWQKFSNGAYYYFDESTGAMYTNAWKNEGSGSSTKSYYLQSDGTMAINKVVETKQGKYRVDANGVAVEKIS